MGITIYPIPAPAAAKIQKTERITSTQSWTVPADVTSLEVILCGGGGGAGTAAAGFNHAAGAGSVDFAILTVSPSSIHTVTIGAGGAPNSTGGTSSFGSLFSIAGGGYGGPNTRATPSRGSGLGGGGGVRSQSTGVSGSNGGAGAFGLGGGGGAGGVNDNAWFAGPGSSGGGSGTAGVSGAQNGYANSGGGGGGADSNLGSNGGSGGSGVAIIKYWSAL